MFGGILETQTGKEFTCRTRLVTSRESCDFILDYVVKCIERILALYEGVKPRPQSVVIIGHSMVLHMQLVIVS